MTFETLLSPLKVGNVILKNRVIMGSMHTGLEEHPDGSSRLAAFYAERARGGVGLIVTGGFSPNSAGRVFEEGAELVSEEQLDFHRPLVKAVHDNGGKIALTIIVSSFSVNDFNNSPSIYGATKLSNEQLSLVFNEKFNTSVTVLKLSNVYGPYSIHKNSVIHSFFKKISTICCEFL